jgi:hypothetical protein
MTLPLDSDGFLRRECSSCERQFKWHPSQSQTTAAQADDQLGEDLVAAQDEDSAVEYYYCPYCGEPAAPTAWWTREQLEYGQALATAEIVAPQLRDLADSLKSLNTRGGMISLKVAMDLPDFSRPEPLTEPDDMVRVDFPCHPEEPIKVEEAWEGEVACLVCGIRYPFDIVRELP